LKFRVSKRKPYPERPETLGGHLLRARSLKGLKQVEAAEEVGVNEFTYLLWENDRTEPNTRYWPALIHLIGYDPNPAPTCWNEELTAKRRALGLTVKKAAHLAGVDEGTFSRWERGLSIPHQQKHKLEQFLLLVPPEAPD
jgi:DNA-binding XRE family transcriptional regulator